MPRLHTVTNMPKYVRAMPKYALICQNKKCSKISRVLNMPYAVAYIIYLSIFRTLTYPETVACSEPIQRFNLSVSFRILCNPSIFRIWGIFRTLSNIYDGAFLRKYLTAFSWVLNIPLI